ncbi:hypothetical protein V9K67_22580 [Paraflavisolibacter sp. H34]|uniref:hypothetical protein n=1 Tax=Huijunlia imazamoxiresistens TaxID=3127457 RepID=UPI00301965A1
MEFISVTLFQGNLAHYNVSSLDGTSFEAKLLRYKGAPETVPPIVLKGILGGRHWSGNEEHQDLLDDLGYATREQFKSGEAVKGTGARSDPGRR